MALDCENFNVPLPRYRADKHLFHGHRFKMRRRYSVGFENRLLKLGSVIAHVKQPQPSLPPAHKREETPSAIAGNQALRPATAPWSYLRSVNLLRRLVPRVGNDDRCEM